MESTSQSSLVQQTQIQSVCSFSVVNSVIYSYQSEIRVETIYSGSQVAFQALERSQHHQVARAVCPSSSDAQVSTIFNSTMSLSTWPHQADPTADKLEPSSSTWQHGAAPTCFEETQSPDFYQQRQSLSAADSGDDLEAAELNAKKMLEFSVFEISEGKYRGIREYERYMHNGPGPNEILIFKCDQIEAKNVWTRLCESGRFDAARNVLTTDFDRATFLQILQTIMPTRKRAVPPIVLYSSEITSSIKGHFLYTGNHDQYLQLMKLYRAAKLQQKMTFKSFKLQCICFFSRSGGVFKQGRNEWDKEKRNTRKISNIITGFVNL